MKNKSLLMTVAILIIAMSSLAQGKSTFTDPRDGKTYKTIKIGTQTWMAENLNYKMSDSYCNNINDYEQLNDKIGSSKCKEYGRLYTYYSALTASPPGWHLPSDAEWETLIDYLGGANVAEGKLKSTTSWRYDNTVASNSSGFTALPGGFRYPNGKFYPVDLLGYWWSSTENSKDKASVWVIDNVPMERLSSSKESGYSIRCVRDD